MRVPLIGFIGRLDYQKGADLVLGAASWLLSQDVQIVCLGTGDKRLEVICSCHRAALQKMEQLEARGFITNICRYLGLADTSRLL